MKKLNVNEEACIGCGACVAIDGAHFDFNDNGLSEVISNENIESEECKNAMSSCPTNAISYIDDSEEEKKCNCENCTCDDCKCDGDECHCPGCGETEECHCKEDNESCHCEHCDCE
ncbi:MAG: ferredoxin [Bacilli bacterium]|nr:ferredoxin [Bacilli bacterium]